MFGIGLNEMRRKLRQVLDVQYRFWAGAAFVVMAMASIQYDEVIAPEMHRLSDAWSGVATDFSKRFASFTL